VHKWRRHILASARPNCADSRDEGGTSDDGGAADRLGGIGWRRNSGCWRRIDCGSDLRVDVRPVNFRTVNSGRDSARYYTTRYNPAWYNAAGYNNAWNGRANPGYCSSDAGNRDSGNHPEHDHNADPADDAGQHYDSTDHSQHAGNNAFDPEYQSKFAGSGINQSSEQHSPDYNTTNHAKRAASGRLAFRSRI
jgi:hypothetical protein